MTDCECRQFEIRFHEILDSRQSVGEATELQAHAAGCQRCAGILKAQSAIEFALDSTGIPGQDGEVLVAQQTRLEQHSKASNAPLFASLTAAVALLVMAFRVFGPSSGLHSPPGETTHDQRPAFQTLSGSLATQGQAHSQHADSDFLTRSTHPSETAESSQIAGFSSFEIPDILHHHWPATEWLDPVAAPLRPVADSVNSAINVLRQSLPGGGAKKTPDQNQTSLSPGGTSEIA